MVRGGKISCKRNGHKRIQSKGKGSDDSDEDYVVSNEENVVSDGSDEDFCSYLDEDASEEDFDIDEDEGKVKEKVGKVVRSKPKKGSSGPRRIPSTTTQKRRRIYCEEEEEEEQEEEEENENYGEDEDEDYDDNSDEEDDNDDDEEFTLDEEDSSHEEKRSITRKRKNHIKVGKQSTRKKGLKRCHKRKRKSNVPKPSRKRRRKNHSSKRKPKLPNDDDLEDNSLTLRVKSKKNPGQRKRRYVALSDTDLVSSGSSDQEYTISEEEREQVREANELFGSLATNSRSSSLLKEIPEHNSLRKQRKSLVRKGKEKVEEVKAEMAKQVCGICLSEEDKRRVRGTLDCCTHFFCFACIMEWAKVESRCPLCKQRFKTISKPARSATGVDLREVVIPVPERDQVYQPSEEELRSYLDPYENVICTECHEGGDDGLMLLCDLCDSPAHTYCVGLGREVPEGNWYCEGCRPVALGSSSQAQGRFSDRIAFMNNLSTGSSLTIGTGEGIDLNAIYSPRAPFLHGFRNRSSPRFPAQGVQSPGSGAGAPTLSGRRWIHRHIQQLLSSNRASFTNGRINGISAASLSNHLLNSQPDQGRGTTLEDVRAPEMGTPYHTFFEERLRDNPSSSVQYGDFFSSGSSHMRLQAIQNPPTTTSINRQVNGTMLSPMRRHEAQNLNTLPIDRPGNGIRCPQVADINLLPNYDQHNQHGSRLEMGSQSSFSSHMTREGGDFKEQLQSVIQSHLKNLSRDIVLGHSSFKDIETSAINTILAACGLEHGSSEVHSVPSPKTCSHIELMAGGWTSLIKGCCSACFDSFVEDVVKKIMNTTTSPHWLSLGL